MEYTLARFMAAIAWLLKSDGMRRPVSDGMLYAPKLSTRFEAQEIKETGNEED